MNHDPHDPYVLVVCPLCHTRMHPRREKVGGHVTCPDCGTVSPILEPPPAASPAHKTTDFGEYGMRSPEEFGDPTATAVNVPPPQVVDAEAADAPRSKPPRPAPPALILVRCPLCHTRMHPPQSDRGKRISCPDCGTEVVVPHSSETPSAKRAPDLVPGQYGVGAAPPSPPVNLTAILAEQAVPERVPLPEPPKWTMISGVFLFPLQRFAIVRWFYLTVGLLLIGQLIVLGASIMDGSFVGIAGAAILGAVALMVANWTVAFGAACMFSVIRETAAGVDIVEEWPESDWREWLWPLLYVVVVSILATGFPYACSQILRAIGTRDVLTIPWQLAIAGLLFPVLLLSVVENGLILAFYSKPVVRSLMRLPHYWLLFHLETLLPLAGIFAIVWFGFADWAFYVTLLAAPLLAGALLIYARLLGRMAWHIGEMEHRLEAESAEL